MRRVMALCLLGCVSSCVGTLEDYFDRGSGGGGPIDAEPARLRRLTPTQYRNTVRDLLDLSEADAASVDVPADESDVPSLLTVTRLDAAATYLASLGAHRRYVPCDVTAGDDACAAAFIAELGRRAFRHPLTEEERVWLTGVYTQARADYGFSDAVDVVTRVILQAPQTFYVHEQGEPGAAGELVALTTHERAARLSYFLWDTMPDDALFAAADDGRLATVAGVRAEAQRMLADPRALAKAARMTMDWLELFGSEKHVSVLEAVKDPTRFPLDDPALRQALLAEMEAFLTRTWERGGRVSELFTEKLAYVNGPLAELYGVTGPATADEWAWVELPAAQRSGMLTRASFLMVYANPDIPSPIRRGVALWRQVLCYDFPPPPPNASDVKITPDTPEGGVVSIRDAVMAATGEEPCSGCHNTINPAGFPFGHYDALGGWQDLESGTTLDGAPYSLEIDATGELIGSDIEGPIDGALELSARLAESRQVKACFARRIWRAALGRTAADREAGSLAFVEDRLATTDSLQEAVIALVESPGFLYVRRAP